MDKGTTIQGGPFDVLCILHNTNCRTYHATRLSEAPFPGRLKGVTEIEMVRLKRRENHPGSPDLAVARGHLYEMSAHIEVPPENIWLEPKPWNGEAVIWLVPNWRTP